MSRLRFPCLLATVLLALSDWSAAEAQPAPFDMSPERPEVQAPLPQLPRPRSVTPRGAPAPAPEPAPARPPSPEPEQADRPTGTVPAAEEQPEPAGEAPERAMGTRRHLIPSDTLALTGEYSRSAWSVYLTAEQAAAGQSITIAYQNAIVVAPEASDLTLFINNRQIGQERINAPNGSKTIRWVLPAGLLRPGGNDVEVVANQRHRTDCDIRSTYDLWTEIDGAGTFFQFAGDLPPANSAMEAIKSMGADGEGRTHFQMVVPSLGPMEGLAPLLRLAQGLAVMSGMPNPEFTFVQDTPQAPEAGGTMQVAVGTAEELRAVLPALPAGAETGPVSTVIPGADGRAPLVVVTGPTWTAVGGAIEAFISPLLRSPTQRRDSMSTERWSRPNAPFLFGGETLTFAQFGISTVEFSGRRFRTGFSIAVPSDFYAGGYGEAVIHLDAAYGASVAGGSHIDVYVNGNIASTVPVTEEGGGILRQAPIQVTMRHLRPGINRIEIEAVLLSDADATCAPGTNASTDARFALFDSSSFHMPSYARIGQTPNLAALSGTGSPYSRQSQPTALFVDRIDTDMLSAAANFLGKAAQVSGAPIVLEPRSSVNAIGGRNAIYLGTAAQLPPSLLAQLNLDPNIAGSWVASDATAQGETNDGPTMEAWRSRLQGGYVSQSLAEFRTWLQEKLDLTEGALRFLPGNEGLFNPDADHDLLLAQGPGANGEGVWTVLTAPNARELRLGSAELARESLWQQVEGRVFSYSRSANEATATEARRLSFLPPVDQSFWNWRLIAANWLSSNLLSYGLMIVLVSCLLGVTTAGLLRWIGRRE